MFLRCLESNLLSDMALQGIENISKVYVTIVWQSCDCHVTVMCGHHYPLHTPICTVYVHVYCPDEMSCDYHVTVV